MRTLTPLLSSLLLLLLPQGLNGQTFEEVGRIFDDFKGISSGYLLVGNASGIVYTHQKGDTGYETEMEIMSASKWISGVSIMKLVEGGRLSLDDYAHQFLDFWSDDPSDPRSGVKLSHLLSFTSGFEGQLHDPACISQDMELYECAKICYENGTFKYPPGEVHKYGSIHLQFAGAIAEKVSGMPFREHFAKTILLPLDMKHTQFNTSAGNNPALAFGLITSTSDYHKFLRAYFLDEILREDVRKLMELDYTPNRDGVALPGYHYSLTNWFECRMLRWTRRCLEENIHGSVGAFGFYPLVDRSLEYYILLGTDSGWPGGTTLASLLRHQIKPILDQLMSP